MVWGTGRGCLRSLRAPCRFQGGWPLQTLLDLRCPWSLGWGSRRWSAFGRGGLGVCVGAASLNLIIRTSKKKHQESLRQAYQHACRQGGGLGTTPGWRFWCVWVCKLRCPPSTRRGFRALDSGSSGACVCRGALWLRVCAGRPWSAFGARACVQGGCDSAWLGVAAGLVGLWTLGIPGPCATVARARWADLHVVPCLGLGACGRGR